MKYIDSEKLYKQVDELMAHFAELEKETKPDDEDLSIFYQGKVKMCSELLDIIDSLQQEQPEVDLEKAAEEYADKHGFRVPYDGSDKYYDDVDVKASLEGFKAGAKWMENQFEHCGTFPIEDSRGGYWPTDYYIKKK